MNPINALAAIRRLAWNRDENGARVDRLRMDSDQLKINQGLILSSLNERLTTKNLKAYEFKVFSQWGEDGIIQHLVSAVDIKNRTFIEFGVENFSESNCRFLLMKDNWKGFVIDGSTKRVRNLRRAYYFWQYQLAAVDAFITKDNINELLAESGFDADVGILSIDIDGNDFYVLDAIHHYKPRILICEYNAVLGPDRKISVPYAADFHRAEQHYSNLYYGASLPAMTYLANRKGYTLVGTNSTGSNAFFVRNDVLNDRVMPLTAEQAYVSSNVRESRGKRGELTYLAGDDRLNLIKGLPVYNVESKQLESL